MSHDVVMQAAAAIRCCIIIMNNANALKSLMTTAYAILAVFFL